MTLLTLLQSRVVAPPTPSGGDETSTGGGSGRRRREAYASAGHVSEEDVARIRRALARRKKPVEEIYEAVAEQADAAEAVEVATVIAPYVEVLARAASALPDADDVDWAQAASDRQVRAKLLDIEARQIAERDAADDYDAARAVDAFHRGLVAKAMKWLN